jgi:hypothetical protein
MSVYSSTDQTNLLKNIFTPEFQFGAGGFFQPTVKTYLPGNVEIGDPTTDYHLFLNGNSLATDTTIAAWSSNPAISTLSMGSNSITNVCSMTFVSGNSFVGTTGTIQNLSGVRSLNGYALTVSSAITIGTNVIQLGESTLSPNFNACDQICIGSNTGSANIGESLIAIGCGAGNGSPTNVPVNAGGYVVAIGRAAGQLNTVSQCVFMGYTAGRSNSGGNSVIIGNTAGYGNSGSNTVAIGYQAAMNNTSSEVVAIGSTAAMNNSGGYVVGIGYQAGKQNTGSSVVAIGYNAGANNSASNCIFLGCNSTTPVNAPNTTPNTFYVYSTVNNTAFLQGDMSRNALGIGQAPVAAFGLAVKGAVQNTLNISTGSGILNLTSNNACFRFFVSNTVTLSFAPTTIAGTQWIVTNTSSSAISASICGGTVYGAISVSLASTVGGVGRSTTFAYSGTGTNFYAF